jgi:RHS repeat-associated protein
MKRIKTSLSGSPIIFNNLFKQHDSVVKYSGFKGHLNNNLLRVFKAVLKVTNLKLINHGLVVMMLLLTGISRIAAQNSSANGIPAEMKAGQSTTSTYARDKIETVNLANGNFTMSIPLATIGGRGSAVFTIALTYNSKVWTSQLDREPVYDEHGAAGTPLNHYSAMYEKVVDYDPYVVKLGGGWTILASPGIKGKLIGVDHMPTSICNSDTDGIPDCGFKYALTKMWLTLPDGSQVELRDSLTEGAPSLITQIVDGYHVLSDRDRGRVWHSFDGSNVTFIRDAIDPPQAETFYPSGWVFLGDGTRLRMDYGTCSKIGDSNGNFITIGGGTYTDQLGRQTLLQVSENSATVTFKGYMGLTDKIISIDLTALGNLENLRADYQSIPRPFTTGDALRDQLGNYYAHTIQGPHTDLFTESEGVMAYGTTDGDDVGARKAVTKLNLPDGRSLRFHYNAHGEVAEIVYPAGGVSQIDYEGGVTSICETSAPIHSTLNRRVSQRRSLVDGINVDATWIYSKGGEVINGVVRPSRSVEVRQGNATGPLLTSEKHLFLAVNWEYRICGDSSITGTGNEHWESAKEFRTEIQTGTGTTTTVRQWQQRAPLVWANDVGLSYNDYVVNRGQDQAPNDPRVQWEETTLENGKTRRVEYGYDNFNNVVSSKEYDFGTPGIPGPLLRETVRQYAGSSPTLTINSYCYTNLNPLDSMCGGGLASDPTKIIHQKHLLLHETIKDGTGVQRAFSEFEFDNYSSDANHASLVIDAGMIQYDPAQFSIFANAYQPRGNITRTKRWAGASDYIYGYNQFNNAGHVIWSKDPNGNVSLISYADNFGVGSNPDAGSAGPFGLTYAMATLATNAIGHQTKIQFDYTRGVPTGVKDPNGLIAKAEYDLLGRAIRTTVALGLPEQSVTETSYPTATQAFATVSTQLDASRWLASKSVIDGFDQLITSWTSEDGLHANFANYSIRQDFQLDGLGRTVKVSNPYRPSAGEIAIYTTTEFDLSGRVKSITTPDSAVVSTVYSGNEATVTDQAQKKRKSVTDALGRLKQVYEDPTGSSLLTTYEYDTLGNLTKVIQDNNPQAPIQPPRIFGYDPLSRLRTATNPESGTITYDYDNNGNLKKKTDALGVYIEYVYDALNRNTSADYSNTSIGNPNIPDITRSYDGATNGIGRLWQSYAGGNETVGTSVEHNKIVSYDAAGRPRDQRQRFKSGGVWSSEYQTQRAYTLTGNVSSQTYASGRVISYSYDGAGRTSAFSGNLGDGTQRNYSTGILYSPLGGMTKEQFGTSIPIYNKLFYNSRGQLAEMRAGISYTGPADLGRERGSITNSYSSQCAGMCGGSNSTTPMPDNNGNLRQQEHWIPDGSGAMQASYAQSFAYDSLNRLQRVTEATSWQQEFVYDRYGNRTIHQTNTWGTGIPKPNFGVNNTTNRLTAPIGYSMTYDARGNLITDTFTGAGSRTYDAENRMIEAWGGNSQWQYYTYNADGQRTRRKIDAVETWQIYGFDGELLAEYSANGAAASPQKEYGYRNGQLLITAEPGTGVVFSDDFNDNSLDTSKWNIDYPTSPISVSESGQRLQITLAPNTAGYNGVSSNATYDLTDKSVQVELVQAVSFAGYCENFLQVVLNSNNLFLIDVGGQGNLLMRSRVNGVNDQTVIPFNAVTHRYWRIRHDAGTNTIKFETSPDVTNWTTLKTVNVGFSLTALKFNLYAGAWGTGNSNPGAAKYDNFQLIGSAGSTTKIQWLVTDQLGTPRMIFDQSGTLANTKRHDYLPFGEELFAGTGGRTTAQGYGSNDGIRQQFTSKERDVETGLDYFLARHYSSTQGRFTSPDQPLMDQEEGDPQSWNLYSYVRNNPLKFTDPTGEARWQEINGELHWVGDEDGEYDADLKASWVADENNPIGGYWDFAGDQSAVEIQEPENTIAVRTGPDKAIEVPIFEPGAGGGLRDVTRRAGPPVARGLSNLFRRAWRGIFGGAARAKTLDELFKTGRLAKASEIAEWAKAQGWTARQTPNGPLKFIDENGVVRVTLKSGSSRAPGSNFPHVELWNAAGQRVDPSGNAVTRTSPGNHTPIQWDW